MFTTTNNNCGDTNSNKVNKQNKRSSPDLSAATIRKMLNKVEHTIRFYEEHTKQSKDNYKDWADKHWNLCRTALSKIQEFIEQLPRGEERRYLADKLLSCYSLMEVINSRVGMHKPRVRELLQALEEYVKGPEAKKQKTSKISHEPSSNSSKHNQDQPVASTSNEVLKESGELLLNVVANNVQNLTDNEKIANKAVARGNKSLLSIVERQPNAKQKVTITSDCDDDIIFIDIIRKQSLLKQTPNPSPFNGGPHTIISTKQIGERCNHMLPNSSVAKSSQKQPSTMNKEIELITLDDDDDDNDNNTQQTTTNYSPRRSPRKSIKISSKNNTPVNHESLPTRPNGHIKKT